ncbi:Uncharacterised protein [Klebsiella pneumoniae subsp. ozaenae]|uniref:Uncharacterized protein n=1 Tax=Klebsiella pneumoniae subsp. ozaenae TaxID=574 RepID=A0A378B594_KLEPO|nr:Uncharacterised protein [Klebsiella pneumoniae subsp. ozaenae]
MLDEIDLLPFFTLTVFISAINFTEIYRLITECRKINKFISCRSRGNYFVDLLHFGRLISAFIRFFPE